MNDQELETRLRARYRARAAETEPAPLALRRDAAAIPRTAQSEGRRLTRGRGMGLLAAAAVLIVGGAIAASSGALRLPSAPAQVDRVAVASPPSPSDPARPTTGPTPAGSCGPLRVWAIHGNGYERVTAPFVTQADAVVGFGGGPGWNDEVSIEAIAPDGERVANAPDIPQIPPHVVFNQVGVWHVSVRDQTSGCVSNTTVTVSGP